MSETYNGCDTGEYIAVPGPQGPQGQRGAQGLQGVPGPIGPQGEPGAVGPQGPCGPKGDRGPRGEKGDKGEPGTPGARGPEGPEGPRGCNGKDGVVTWSDEITPEQIDLLRGPQGPKGDRGQRGEAGPMGGLGPRGPKGEKGDQGEPGAPGPMGPRGLMGPMGPQGLRGYTGPQGPAGGAQLDNNNINNNNVFSSQKTVDFMLHGNTDWIERKGHNLVVPHTQNGYVKNFKVLGKTLRNYCNFKPEGQESADDSTLINNPTLTTPNTKLLYDSKGDVSKYLYSETFTLMYDITDVNEPLGGDFDRAVLKLTTVHYDTTESGPDINKEVQFEIREGSNKVVFSPENHERIKKIEVLLYKFIGDGGEEEQQRVSFKAKNFMILSGDWTNYVCPDYFYKEKSIGKPNKDIESMTDPKKKYYIDIESRNKNLIDESAVIKDKFLEALPAQEEPQGAKTLRWANDVGEGVGAPLARTSITFLINVVPGWSYALRKTNKKMKQARLSIAGYKDAPQNGEAGVNLMYVEPGQGEEVSEKTFTVPEGINVLALYLGRFENYEQEVSDILGDLQLEQVRYDTNTDPHTSYEKFTKRTKRLYFSRQIKSNEYLYWDEAEGAYCVFRATGKKEVTPNTDEYSIHTYDGMTYIYIASRVPTEISGEFPIKGHDDYYTKDYVYTKDQTDDKILELAYSRNAWKFGAVSTALQNSFLSFPNGVVMQWQLVTLEGNGEKRVAFDKVKAILHAQATPFIAGGGGLESAPERVGIKQGVNTSEGGISLTVYGASNDSTKRVMVLVIGLNKVIVGQ